MSRNMVRKLAGVVLGLSCVLVMSSTLPGCIAVHTRCKGYHSRCCKKKCAEGCTKPCCKKKCPKGCTKPCCAKKTETK